MQDCLKEVRNGYHGTKDTIAAMKTLVDKGKRNRQLINLAQKIVRNVKERDKKAENAAILKWVQKNIRFVNDPYGVETVRDPYYLVTESRAGDCDDLSTLFNTLSSAIGYDTAFKTIKADKKYPGQFSHVYSLVKINDKWIPADPSQKNKPLGWEPPVHNGHEIWGYSNGNLKRYNNMGKFNMPNRRKGIFLNYILQKLKLPQNNLVKNHYKDEKRKFIVKLLALQRYDPDTFKEIVKKIKQNGFDVSKIEDRIWDPDQHNYYGDNNSPAGTYKYKEILPFFDDGVSQYSPINVRSYKKERLNHHPLTQRLRTTKVTTEYGALL